MLHTEPLSAQARAFPGLNHRGLEGTVLATIINRKVSDVARLERAAVRRTLPRVSFQDALSGPGRHFILECKRSSPSLGDFCADFNLDLLASCYEEHAQAVSVLCEEHFFKGSLDFLTYVKSRTTRPVLCKDFIICEAQLERAASAGADAVLLMFSVLSPARMRELYEYARALGLDTLCEVENEEECALALRLGCPVVGINNRDLKQLKIDLTKAQRLCPLFPESTIVVSESGIKSHGDVVRLRPLRNFLIGSAITGTPDPAFTAKTICHGLTKICGIRTAEALEAAVEGQAAIAGLIFAPRSPRFIAPAEALKLIEPFRGRIRFAGVFVDAPIGTLLQTADGLKLDYVQLHGSESLELVKELRRARPALGIIKACNVTGPASFEKILPYQEQCDLILLDSGSPGSGTSFDWTRIPAEIDRERTLLSGGIGLDNLNAALALGLAGVDLNSRLEGPVRGLKDPLKIRAALRLVNEF